MVPKSRWLRKQAPTQKVPIRLRRGAVTHVALICERPEVQKHLPQIFIGNHSCFTKKLLASIASTCPSSVQFWRRPTSWNTSSVMVQVIQAIAAALATFKDVQFVLCMDCAPVHLTAEVLQAAAARKFWILPVPAKTTWLLQPLDCSVFASYKAFLRKSYRTLKMQHPEGEIRAEQWLAMLIDVATVFLNGRSWAEAFQSVGMASDRCKLSRPLQRLMQGLPSACAASPVLRPRADEVRNLLPVGKPIHYWKLFPGQRLVLRL